MKDQNQVGNLQLDVNNSFYALLHYNTVSIQLFKDILKLNFFGGKSPKTFIFIVVAVVVF